MEILIKKMPMQIDEETIKDMYRVDCRLIGGFGGSKWRTFGVYESKDIAVFVAENIKNGHIII